MAHPFLSFWDKDKMSYCLTGELGELVLSPWGRFFHNNLGSAKRLGVEPPNSPDNYHAALRLHNAAGKGLKKVKVKERI